MNITEGMCRHAGFHLNIVSRVKGDKPMVFKKCGYIQEDKGYYNIQYKSKTGSYLDVLL